MNNYCDGADLDRSGKVDFKDHAIFSIYWLDSDCAELSGCNGADVAPVGNPDGHVNLLDLAVFIEHWLQTECNNPETN